MVEALSENVSVFLPDLKTLNPLMSKELFQAENYPRFAKRAISAMVDASPLRVENGEILSATTPAITAQCLRVPVSDGHTAAVFVKFDTKPTKEEILSAWANFKGVPQELKLPSAPEQFLQYFEEDNRPQAKLDRMAGNGMSVTVGRLREDVVFDYKFVGLSHNTLRGAAGGAVLLAELLAAKGYFD
jgi:aspartate-semialdehyde dehydrogenase